MRLRARGRRRAPGAGALLLAAGLVLAGGRGVALTVQSNAVPASAASSTNAPLRDIHGAVDIPNPWRRAGWLAGAVVLVAAAIAGVMAWRRRQPPAVAGGTVESPAEEARRRFVEARQWMGDPRRFAGAVSDAVRLYLEARFGLRAPEQTTEEFLADLRARPLLDVRHQGLLAEFLEQCDLLKFAGARSGPEVPGELLTAATRLVDETDPGVSAGPSRGGAT